MLSFCFFYFFICLVFVSNHFYFLFNSFCIVADYAQNLGAPHFGGEQPGDSYYYSPLSVYCFGVVDVCGEEDILHAYGYTEDHGAKGGNNVASLLMKALQDLGWLNEGRCGARLSIIMDNCAGQNKNGHVLRLALWLVELQYFRNVEFIFYVRGHTKNVCDRMFNLLKKRYHRSQIFSIGKLSSLLNEIDNVNYNHVTSEVFFDYLKLLDKFYKKFVAGSVKKNHWFWVDDSSPTVMNTQSHHNDEDAERTTNNHLIRMQDRLNKMKEAFNNKQLLKAPGMKPIKQVELWKKWGPFIPEDERNELCPKPPTDIIKAVAEERASKQAGKKRARSRTNNN